MVISLGAGTHVFQLDRDLGEFVLTQHSIKMPSRGIYITGGETTCRNLRRVELRPIEYCGVWSS